MSEIDAIRARILAFVTEEQMPFAEFELRMLTTTLESANLQYIHQYWRPIAAERDALREQIAKAVVAPRKARTPDVATLVGDDDDSPRFKALSVEHNQLKRNHGHLKANHEALQAEHDAALEELAALKLAHKKLQADCDDLLDDRGPRRSS